MTLESRRNIPCTQTGSFDCVFLFSNDEKPQGFSHMGAGLKWLRTAQLQSDMLTQTTDCHGLVFTVKVPTFLYDKTTSELMCGRVWINVLFISVWFHFPRSRRWITGQSWKRFIHHYYRKSGVKNSRGGDSVL